MATHRYRISLVVHWIALVVLPASAGSAAPPVNLPLVYTNDEFGFSMRYPANLHPVAADPEMLGAGMGYALVMDFMSADRNSTFPVVRIIVKRPKPPMYPPMKLEDVRRGCRPYRATTVGGRAAGVCTVCGRGACGWTVEIPGPPDVSIISRFSNFTPAPRDGRFPVRSMIESIRFHRAPQP